MKQRIKFIFTTWFIAISLFTINAQDIQTNKNDMENLNLTNEWDKTFPQSDKVKHSKVTFRNRYGITLAADLYMPKNVEGKLPAIAVCGPFGAVKEQASGLYAQTMAERGFLTIAFDPSFTGESGGAPRYVASPDINTEDFCAAVDFLSLRDDVDSERIGIIGICGWGGLAINAAAIDTRIKATVASTMYDMSRCTANGYFDENDNADARYEMRRQLNDQRTIDARNGSYETAGGVVDLHMRLQVVAIYVETEGPAVVLDRLRLKAHATADEFLFVIHGRDAIENMVARVVDVVENLLFKR